MLDLQRGEVRIDLLAQRDQNRHAEVGQAADDVGDERNLPHQRRKPQQSIEDRDRQAISQRHDQKTERCGSQVQGSDASPRSL